MWICRECGLENDDSMIRCICGYDDMTIEDNKIETTEEMEDINSEKWFYNLNGNQIGPISAATLKNRLIVSECG